MLTVDKIKAVALPLAKKYDVEKIDLFGSYARGNATEASDADFLVKFHSDAPSIFKVMGFREELANGLRNPVDVVTLPLSKPESLKVEEVISIL